MPTEKVSKDDSNETKRKKAGNKEFNSDKYIETEPTLDEAAGTTAVIAWGRMNPMTAGHEKLVKKVMAVAKSERGQPEIYLTHSVDRKQNPLGYEDKIKFAQKAFGPVVKKSNAKTIFQLMKQLEKRFKRVILVAGSDRVKEFDTTLNKYNGKEYNFDEIKVVSAGQRDADSDDVSGISGTKMRGYAMTDMKKFKANLPKKLQSDADEIATLVSMGMNMSESDEINYEKEEALDEVVSRMTRRKMGIAARKNRHKMKRGREKAARKTATMDVIKKRARKQAIVNLKSRFAKNKRYADMSPGEKEVIDKKIAKFSKKRIEMMARRLIPAVKKAERDRKMTTKKEDLNVAFESFLSETTGKYYTGVAKDKKDDREAHFDRNAKKSDSDPSAYRPAPGDKEAKTKESKHTKKARAMGFTEETEDLNEMWGKYVTKRPHMLMDRNGKVKFDGRFKMFKPKGMVTEEVEDFNSELNSLMESVEDYALELNEDPSASLKKKADKTGMPMGILRKVYNRGVAAWKTGHRPGTTPEQWGHARVNSFITKSSGTWGKADKDLAAKVRKESVDEEKTLADVANQNVKDKEKTVVKKKFVKIVKKSETEEDDRFDEGAGEEGTNKLVNKFKKDTPNVSEKLDRTQYHTSVERGVFGKHSSDGNKEDYLLDLDNKAGGKKDGPPMLVTFGKEADAKKAQKKFGGTIVKTKFGTYRIKK